MKTEGVKAIFLTTHNWGKSAKFFQSLGYELEFETDHNSGQLRNESGPYLFIAEVPESEKPDIQMVLKIRDSEPLDFDPAIDVVSPLADTHWGTREMIVRDPDGRTWSLEAPAKTKAGA